MKEEKKNSISRREFISLSTLAGVAAVSAPSLLVSCSDSGKAPKMVPLKAPGDYYLPELTDKAVDGKPLKVGLIGCGGRGNGAMNDVFNAADNVTVTAICDLFEDRMNGVRRNLERRGIKLPDDKCFLGFDAYKKVIDSGVDMVLLCAPPVFRPMHFKYATEKGVHSFLEKPVAVDPEGYRTVMAAAKMADAKKLCVITGTQRHHQRSYVAAYQKVMEGYIGEITGGNVYWNQGMLWYKERQPGWTNMEWMIRDWVNWKWLSGDEIIEQHVHNIDVFTWFFGQKPISATGVGSRQRRRTGDCYDNFSIDFTFENGVHLHSMCRQIDGCSNNISEYIQGTLGSLTLGGNNNTVIRNLKGEEVWKYDEAAAKEEFKQHNPYVLEHVNWINHIRQGQHINQAPDTCISTLAGVMGREAAFTGKTITWDEMSASALSYMPEVLEIADVDMSNYTVSVPGKGR